MEKKNVAILGATGAVGREMIKVLEEDQFPVGELRLLASKRSVGKEIVFNGKTYLVEEATKDSFQGMDIVLGAASNALAKEMAPHIVAAGAVFIDNSSAFRMDENVPLVVPEINPEDAKKHQGIIANPNCSTIITSVAVNPINRLSKIKALVASTYQASSGAGAGGPVELMGEVEALAKGETYTPSVFPYQLAYNLIPCIGSASTDEYTTEEMKLENEGRKIMHLPEMKATCTCVRVPVIRSHAISVSVITEDPVEVSEVRKILSDAPGVKLTDDLENKIYPMPLDTSDQNLVFAGRIRKGRVFDNEITLFCAGDQVRKGAAANAVQIAELLLQA